MSGNRFLLDTNAIIALLRGNQNISQIIIGAEWVGVSIISVMEYISFPDLSKSDLDLLKAFLKRVEVVDLKMSSFGLLVDVSQIRITFKLKLPDAIVAATAIANGASLITADAGFKKVAMLQTISF
jgi:tRNA(fMet)-specific endonuclease VapC